MPADGTYGIFWQWGTIWNCETTVEWYFVDDDDDGDNGPGFPPGNGGGGGGGSNNPPPTGPVECNPNHYLDNGLIPCEEGNTTGWTIKDEHGFYFERIQELKDSLENNPNFLLPCDSLAAFNNFGAMWQQVAAFQMPSSLINRIDSVNNLFPDIDLTEMAQQSLSAASGATVNCDFFPIRITSLPTGFTSQTLLEYFRTHISDFSSTSFSPYSFSVPFGNSINDTTRFYSPYVNSVGALVHINIFGNNGTVIESDYQIYHSPPNTHESQQFTFSTLQSQLDNFHPVGGNRAFGIYNSSTIQGNILFIHKELIEHGIGWMHFK